MLLYDVSFIYFIIFVSINAELKEDCKSKDTSDKVNKYLPHYLLYDVNPPEGFNLRRDVFMRLAVFVKSLKSSCSKPHWHLVLPPWPHLYHWNTHELGLQHLIPWSQFFDVESMKRYVDIVEMYEIIKEIGTELDISVILQNYKDAFTGSWTWEDKWEFSECNEDVSFPYAKVHDGYEGHFWGYPNITCKEVFCASFQGQASKIKEILDSVDRRLVMIDHAEIALHDNFGNSEYWKCRRSMRFSSTLVAAANEFRITHLDSRDESDGTLRPERWEDEKLHRTAKGGPYLGVHLRRQDYEFSRKNEIPNLKQAAQQISNKLDELNLTKVYISTDAPLKFIVDLKRNLPKYEVYYYDETPQNKKQFGDGSLAIIDQIICSHARYFIGSHESTFSFRIQEEREILGFPVETTFNRFCGINSPCTEPTKWLIVH